MAVCFGNFPIDRRYRFHSIGGTENFGQVESAPWFHRLLQKNFFERQNRTEKTSERSLHCDRELIFQEAGIRVHESDTESLGRFEFFSVLAPRLGELPFSL